MFGYLGTRANTGFCCIPGQSGYMYVDLFITLKQLAVNYKINGFCTWGLKSARILHIGLWLYGIEYTEILKGLS